MPSLFVSYSSRDSVEVARLCDWLTAQGFVSLFLDFDPERGVPAGAKWEAELYSQMRRAEAVLFVATRPQPRRGGVLPSWRWRARSARRSSRLAWLATGRIRCSSTRRRLTSVARMNGGLSGLAGRCGRRIWIRSGHSHGIRGDLRFRGWDRLRSAMELFGEEEVRIRSERVAAQSTVDRLSGEYDLALANLDKALSLTEHIQAAYDLHRHTSDGCSTRRSSRSCSSSGKTTSKACWPIPGTSCLGQT
jgi:hypothetical protein